jgi:hypothetical protein
MKKTNLLCLAVVFISLNLLFSCTKDDNPVVAHPFAEIKGDATFHGNFKSDIVVVNTQGGPETKLDDESLKETIKATKTSSALYVNVHQTQTSEPHLFTKTDITFSNAKKYDERSVARLKKVIDYFKMKKKKVYVLGISFGAFMTQELIADYGIDSADGYLIIAGRLDIDEDTWKPFSEGKRTTYVYDQNGGYTINLFKGKLSVEEKNMARLAAGLGFNRYTERLKDEKDLSKIRYIYGTHDEQVGPLSKEEIKFLEDRNVGIGKNQGANHQNAIQAGLTILKSAFRI